MFYFSTHNINEESRVKKKDFEKNEKNFPHVCQVTYEGDFLGIDIVYDTTPDHLNYPSNRTLSIAVVRDKKKHYTLVTLQVHTNCFPIFCLIFSIKYKYFCGEQCSVLTSSTLEVAGENILLKNITYMG